MTATKKEAGAWGGIHICGKAHSNVEGGTGKSEIGDATYGGSDDADNSGVLKYVRIEYSGYAFDSEHEANGFTFYGVGNGTTIEYCQAYKGSDDGFEFFGGSVNVKHVVSVSCSDDSFDWTEGWNGYGQFMVAYQTLIGNGGSKQGIRLRAGTQASIYNALITGKGMCLTTETAETEDALVDGTSVLNYITMATDITCNGAE